MPNDLLAKEPTRRWTDPQFFLGAGVLAISMVGLFVIAGISLKGAGEEMQKYVFAAFVPVLASWVGTVLAYYFSRENFESANRSVRQMVGQISPAEKLASVSVASKMIPRQSMDVLVITPDKPENHLRIIADILAWFDKFKRNRLPVLDEQDRPKYIVHRSMIDKYLTLKMSLSVDAQEQLTFRDLLDEDIEMKRMFESGFTTVSQDSTMADAKTAMEKISDCKDVFVTKSGTKNDPVLGWITELQILESATV